MMSASSCPDLASHTGTAAPRLPLAPDPPALAPSLLPTSTKVVMKRPKAEAGWGGSQRLCSASSTACSGEEARQVLVSVHL
jgi:hypothetical protein